MKQILFLTILFSLTIFSCKKSDSIDSIPTSLDGKWRMIVVKENISGLTTTKPSSISGEVEITFTSTNSTNGTFVGITPSNDILQNDYSVGLNQTITIPNLSMTKVMETSWGDEFVENIRDCETYNFEIGRKLNIVTVNKTLTFEKL